MFPNDNCAFRFILKNLTVLVNELLPRLFLWCVFIMCERKINDFGNKATIDIFGNWANGFKFI